MASQGRPTPELLSPPLQPWPHALISAYHDVGYQPIDKVALLARWALAVEVKAPERR